MSSRAIFRGIAAAASLKLVRDVELNDRRSRSSAASRPGPSLKRDGNSERRICA